MFDLMYFIIAFIIFIVGSITLYSYIFIEYGEDSIETYIFILSVLCIFLMSLIWIVTLSILIIILIIYITLKLSENKLKMFIIKIYGKFIIKADGFIIGKDAPLYLYTFYKDGKEIKYRYFNGYYKFPLGKVIKLK